MCFPHYRESCQQLVIADPEHAGIALARACQGRSPCSFGAPTLRVKRRMRRLYRRFLGEIVGSNSDYQKSDRLDMRIG